MIRRALAVPAALKSRPQAADDLFVCCLCFRVCLLLAHPLCLVGEPLTGLALFFARPLPAAKTAQAGRKGCCLKFKRCRADLLAPATFDDGCCRACASMSQPTAVAPTRLPALPTPNRPTQNPPTPPAPPAAEAGSAVARRLARALATLAERPQALQPWARLALRAGPRRQRALDESLYRHAHGADPAGAWRPGAMAWLCALVCAEVSSLLHWGPALQQALVLSALSQGQSWSDAALTRPPSGATPVPACGCRSTLCARAEGRARGLQQAGVGDGLWWAVTRLQAHRCGDAVPLERLAAAERVARLLRRVLLFLRLTGRGLGARSVTLAAAARRACLGHDGVPDELGNALLQAVGIYPAGSLLRLRSGEAGVVVGRGPRANLPLVAALVDRSGTPLALPRLRHTALARHAVQGAWRVAAASLIVPSQPPRPAP